MKMKVKVIVSSFILILVFSALVIIPALAMHNPDENLNYTLHYYYDVTHELKKDDGTLKDLDEEKCEKYLYEKSISMIDCFGQKKMGNLFDLLQVFIEFNNHDFNTKSEIADVSGLIKELALHRTLTPYPLGIVQTVRGHIRKYYKDILIIPDPSVYDDDDIDPSTYIDAINDLEKIIQLNYRFDGINHTLSETRNIINVCNDIYCSHDILGSICKHDEMYESCVDGLINGEYEYNYLYSLVFGEYGIEKTRKIVSAWKSIWEKYTNLRTDFNKLKESVMSNKLIDNDKMLSLDNQAKEIKLDIDNLKTDIDAKNLDKSQKRSLVYKCNYDLDIITKAVDATLLKTKSLMEPVMNQYTVQKIISNLIF